WLVRAAEVQVLAPIPLGSALDATTTVVGHRRVWARRRAEFRPADGGALLAWVHTDWVLIDARGRITRVPEIFGEHFPAPVASDEIVRVPLPASPAGAHRRTFRVRPQELDPMDHVNNAVYLDWFEESVLLAAPDRGGEVLSRLPRRYVLEYAAAADAGAELEAATWSDGSSWQTRTTAAGADLFRARLESQAVPAGAGVDGLRGR
ncbi:MAG TPA: acyl-ACP thioesterase domain-containing protein, partial [Candidatus Limnocylindrales bacterium]